MNDKERLEEIKNCDIDYFLYGTKLKEYWDWLVEQSERFEKMKKEFAEDVDFKRREVLKLNEQVQELEEKIKHYELTTKNNENLAFKLEKQNKRYRKAIKKAINKSKWNNAESANILLEALEELE